MKTTDNHPNLQQDNTRVLTPQPAASPDQLKKANEALADEILAKDHRKPDPKPEELAKPEPYEADDAENVRNFLTRGINGQFKKAGAKTEDGKPSDKPAVKPEKPVVKPKPAARKVIPAPTKPAVEPQDVDRIIRATAEATAAALQPKAKEEPAPKGEFSTLEPEEQAKVRVLQQMEKSNPTKYKGLASRYAQSLTALDAYESKWLKDHPGETFDAKAAEHNDFFEKNDVDWSQDDELDARAEMKVAKAREEITGDLNKELDGVKKTAKAQELAPQRHQEAKLTGREFFVGMGEAYAGIVDEHGAVNKDVVAKLKEEDPNWPDIALAATAVEEFAAETFSLFKNIGTYDPAKPTPLQKRIVDFALKCEQDMAQFPPEEQLDNAGKHFCSNAEWSAMKPAQREKHWTYGMRELNALWAAEVQQITKNSITENDKKLEAFAKRRGYSPPTAVEPQKPEVVKPVKPLEERQEKPRSPSTAGGPTVSKPNGAVVKGDENKAAAFLGRGFGR